MHIPIVHINKQVTKLATDTVVSIVAFMVNVSSKPIILIYYYKLEILMMQL